jgi:hypothetical protein
MTGLLQLRATRRKEEIPFAAIPLLFGFQQLVEGLLWLSFKFESPQLNVVGTYLFLVWCFFAAILSSIIYARFRFGKYPLSRQLP